MIKNIFKVSILTSVLFSSNLMANSCEYYLGVSNDIEGQLFKYGKEYGLFNLVEKKHDCKLKISQNNSHIQTVYGLIADQQEVDGAIIKNIDIHYNIGATKSLSNILINQSSNVEVLSKKFNELKSLKNQTIYLTKKTYYEYSLINNLKSLGFNVDSDINIVNVESEDKLIDGFEKGLYENIVLDKSIVSKLNGNKIKLKEPSTFTIISTLERTKDFNKKEKFIQDISFELLSIIDKDYGTEYQKVINKITTENKFANVNETKKIIKEMDFINKKSKLNLYEIEEVGINYIQKNKLNKYNIPYSVNINNKLIGNKKEEKVIYYKNISNNLN